MEIWTDFINGRWAWIVRGWHGFPKSGGDYEEGSLQRSERCLLKSGCGLPKSGRGLLKSGTGLL